MRLLPEQEEEEEEEEGRKRSRDRDWAGGRSRQGEEFVRKREGERVNVTGRSFARLPPFTCRGPKWPY